MKSIHKCLADSGKSQADEAQLKPPASLSSIKRLKHNKIYLQQSLLFGLEVERQLCRLKEVKHRPRNLCPRRSGITIAFFLILSISNKMNENSSFAAAFFPLVAYTRNGLLQTYTSISYFSKYDPSEQCWMGGCPLPGLALRIQQW